MGIIKICSNRLLSATIPTRTICLTSKSSMSSSGWSDEEKKMKSEAEKAVTQTSGDAKSLQELKTTRPLLYPDQMDWLDDRQVRISKPSKNVMQSGTANTKTWKVEFNSAPRWENWLMGWTSSADPVSNLIMNFPSKEDAIAFCDKNSLNWFIEEQPERKIRRKSYAENFSWNKRTRLGNK